MLVDSGFSVNRTFFSPKPLGIINKSMIKTAIAVASLLLFSCSGSNNENSISENNESPLKGINKITRIEYNVEIIDGDTIIEYPHRSIFTQEFDENGYLSKFIFSMSLKNKIPIYKLSYAGDNFAEITSTLNDSLQSTTFRADEYLDFSNGNFDTTTYSFDKKDGNKVFMKGSDGGVEIWEFNGRFISTPNPMNSEQPNSVKKYDAKGFLTEEASFGFQDTYYTKYSITKWGEKGMPKEAFAELRTYQIKQIDNKIKELDFSDYEPTKIRVRFVKFQYE